MEIVSVFNDKGGVGKTSIALEMAAGLSMVGKTTLLIDNDPQGTLSRSCVDNCFKLDGMDMVYNAEKPLSDIPYETFIENMFIAPCGGNLKSHYSRTDDKVIAVIDDMFDLMRGEMANIIDVVIIDNPPTQTGVAFECTKRADKIVIPSRPDDVCFDALVRTYTFLEKQLPDFNEKKITIFPSIVENRKMHRDFTAAMKLKYDGKNDNTKVGITISNRAEVPSTIMEKKVLYISYAASETTLQHKQMCLDIFSWLEKDLFFRSMDAIALQKKIAIREKFKEMVRLRLMNQNSNLKTDQTLKTATV